MRVKERTTYDLGSEQFRYLKTIEINHLNKVDINELNKRLNENKKSSFYFTALVTFLCVSFLTVLILIGIKF